MPKAASSFSSLSSLVTSPGLPLLAHCRAIRGHQQPWLTQIKAPSWAQVGVGILEGQRAGGQSLGKCGRQEGAPLALCLRSFWLVSPSFLSLQPLPPTPRSSFTAFSDSLMQPRLRAGGAWLLQALQALPGPPQPTTADAQRERSQGVGVKRGLTGFFLSCWVIFG